MDAGEINTEKYLPKEGGDHEINYKDDDFIYATFSDRFIATLIDSAISIIPLSILAKVVVLNERSVNDNLIQTAVLLLITVLFWIKLGGTPGKLMMKIYVVDEKSGNYMTTSQSIIRYFGYFVSIIFFFFGFFWVLFDSKKQAWHDKIAKTVVIKKVKKI